VARVDKPRPPSAVAFAWYVCSIRHAGGISPCHTIVLIRSSVEITLLLPRCNNVPLYLRDPLFACYVPNPLVAENVFLKMTPDAAFIPSFASARDLLPHPFWENHPTEIDCYWKAWQIAFGNLGRPTEQNAFIAPYIDTAFNGHLFMWDSIFILMFGRYGARVFDFQRTLDNLYAKQHPDGFICREIDIADGQDCFHRHDPSSTGPNALAWSEWEYYRNFGDRQRLARVFPVLLSYHQWMRDYRTWPDGTYWATGWAGGMDNQPRVPRGYSPGHSPAHQTWVDACMQAVLSARMLIRIANVLGRGDVAADLQEESARLSDEINLRMWDEETAFYYDLRRGELVKDVKTLGAYWALLADVVPPSRLERFLDHLENPREFNRPHRVPSMSADHPLYRPDGDYWRGGIWPSTQYMVLRGLTQCGADRLAHEIAMNHVGNVTRVFEQTGTLWENYAPESVEPGNPAKPDFVGWGGLGPIAGLFEYVFGLRPLAADNRLIWDIRLLDAHGVEHYPFGARGMLNLRCEQRSSGQEQPVVHIASNIPVQVQVQWKGGCESVPARPLTELAAALYRGGGG
jgi:hypothetical protein